MKIQTNNSIICTINKRKNQGFTLAEVLIVVAIIAVLVAIAILVFDDKLEKSREITDVNTMRQAASLAIDFYYQGVRDEASARAAGLKWWENGGNGSNAAGVYNPGSGTFSPISSKDAKNGYGNGTKKKTKKKYTYKGNREIYSPAEDYTNAVVLVSIFPDDHIDVYWKNIKDGKYIGGQSGNNNPNYSIRIDLK